MEVTDGRPELFEPVINGLQRGHQAVPATGWRLVQNCRHLAATVIQQRLKLVGQTGNINRTELGQNLSDHGYLVTDFWSPDCNRQCIDTGLTHWAARYARFPLSEHYPASGG